MSESDNIAPKRKLLKDFDRASGWFRPHLIERYGEGFAELVRQEAREEYEALIPQIPFIGGRKVHMTSDLMESVPLLAYLRVLKAHGKTIEECRDIIFDGTRTRIAQYPRVLLRTLGWMTFTRAYLRNLQSQARDSQERKYPGGFVFDIVVGDGEEFDWGLNFVI